jgi:phosphatidate cytidylyltransferase
MNNFKTKSFVTRLISGIILVLIALATIIAGDNVLLVTMTLVSLVGVFELYRVFNIHNTILGYIGYVATIGYYILLKTGGTQYVVIGLVLCLLLFMAVYVFTFPKYKTEQIMMGLFALVYVSVMLSYIYQVRMGNNGAYNVWLIFLCSWGSDTCAYAVGMAIGKHKMSPVLSPKKSVEGGVGGVVGAALLGFIYAAVIYGIGAKQVWTYPVICAVGALISMVGDLAASAIKRNHDIKDYGHLIPGHGGIMDRFDSVIFTAPIIWFLLLIMK